MNQGDERRHPHPLGHRAGRPPGGRAAPAPGLRRAAQARRPAAGAGEARPDAPGHRPGPRGVPPAGRTPTRPGAGTAAATSSPPRPRPCAASSSRTPAASGGSKRGGGRRRVDLDDVDLAAEAPPRTCWPWTRPSTRLAAEDPPGGRAGQAPLLRRPVRRGGRRGPRHLRRDRRPPLGLRPGLAAPASCGDEADAAADRRRISGVREQSRGRRLALAVGADGVADRRCDDDRDRPSDRGDLPRGPGDRADPSERAAYLDEACGGDAGAARAGRARCSRPTSRPASFLESPAAGADGRPSSRRRPPRAPARSSAPTSCWSRSARGAWASSTSPSRRSPSAARWP